MKRMFVVISALILCTPTWAIEIMDTRKDSNFAGIADCMDCKGDKGICTEKTKNNVTYYEGVWKPGYDCTKFVKNTNYHATKSECRPMAPDNVYKKYREKLIENVWKRPILVPEPSNGKIYRCVATACEPGYKPKNGWCQYFSDSSNWKNEDGNFNTARLVSDSVAGVVLGTAGGVITSKIIKKNQIKKGFEDLKCTVGGQEVATYGDEFTVGAKQ